MHLNNNRTPPIFFYLIFAFLLPGCSKEVKQDKYVAKVNDALLTEEFLDSALTNYRNQHKYRAEFINDWIENEVLYQEAVKEGITKEHEFNSIIEQSKKELATALFIQRLIAENKIDPSEEEIRSYFAEKKEDFKLIDDVYKLNLIKFNNFDKAIQFRNRLIETRWENALNAFRNEQSIIDSKSNVYFYKYQLQPLLLLRLVDNLQPLEVSVIFETEQMSFAVVQLLEKIEKDSDPPFEFVKEEAQMKLIILKKKEFIRNYINKLVSNHNLEIVRYSE